MTRCARDRRVFFWEEPYWDADDKGDGTPTLEVMNQQEPGLWVVAAASCRELAMQKPCYAAYCVNSLMNSGINVERFVRWYYTPMMLSFTEELRAEVTVYDCMDELSGFLGAPCGTGFDA